MQAAYEALFIQYKVNIVYSGHVRARGRGGEGAAAQTAGSGSHCHAREHAAGACLRRSPCLARSPRRRINRAPPALPRSLTRRAGARVPAQLPCE